LTAVAAYNACHAISQVTHHITYDAYGLLGHKPRQTAA